jgi:signal transduction histidine kinase
VTNAVRHGRCRQVSIELAATPEAVTLSVSDDGVGMPGGDSGGGGIGLRIMRYRAQRIGALLELQTGRGSGTTVRCILDPLRGARRDRQAHASESGTDGPTLAGERAPDLEGVVERAAGPSASTPP